MEVKRTTASEVSNVTKNQFLEQISWLLEPSVGRTNQAKTWIHHRADQNIQWQICCFHARACSTSQTTTWFVGKCITTSQLKLITSSLEQDVKFSCPLCNIITQLIYIQRGLRDSNCSSGGKVSGFCDVGCAVKPYTHVWSVKPAVKLCVALFFSLIPSPFPAGDTFLGHEYIWYISSRCVSCISAFRCSYSWKSFSAVGTTEGMNVCLLKLCDSSNYSRLLLYAAPFSCHLAISRTDVVGVRLLKFKEWITH